MPAKPLIADEAIPAVLRVFGESPDFDAGLDAAIDVIADHTEFDAVALLRLSGTEDTLSVVATRGFTRRAVEAGRELPVEGSFSGLAVSRREIVTSSRAASDPRVVPAIRDEMAKLQHELLISVPLVLYRKPVGAMNLAWSQLREFRDEERDCLYCLSYGMAVAIEHTRRDHESRHDALTGLRNRRELSRALRELIARFHRHGAPFSLLWMDVDHFKDTNDRYGHDVGDGILVRLARVLASRLRATDAAFRCGGEEFACILPDTRADDARAAADDLRGLFAATEHLTPEGERARATVSAGVAESRGEPAEDLVRRADAALYRAKALGRNRVVVAGDADEPAGASGGAEGEDPSPPPSPRFRRD